MTQDSEGRKKYKIFIDGRQHEWNRQYISGTELRGLASVGSDVQVFLEEPGEDKPDRPIPIDASINLDEPGVEKFYTIPPATFGK